MFAQKHHAEIDRLTALFVACPIGETLSHATLRGDTDRVLYEYARYQAIRKAQHEAGVVFMNVRGVGYQRVPLENAPQIGRTARRSIGRKARRAARSITAVIKNANGFPPAALRESYREVAILSTTAHLVSRKVATTLPLPETEAHEATAKRFIARMLGA